MVKRTRRQSIKPSRIEKPAQKHSFQEEGASKSTVFKSLLNPVVLGIVLIYLLIVSVYFLNYTPKTEQNDLAADSLQKDKEAISSKLLSSDDKLAPQLREKTAKIVTFVVRNNEVDRDKLRNFASKNYAELKKELGVQNDFCIHFEDKDGNLIDMSAITNRKGVGVGNPELEFTLVDRAGMAVGVVNC